MQEFFTAGTASSAETEPAGRARRQAGFTFIELVLAVTIVAIMARLALPYVKSQIRESRRADGKTALLDLASREERFSATNNTYTSSGPNLYSTGATWPLYVPTGLSSTSDYSIAAPTITSTSFSLTATAINDQANDSCGNYTLDYLGNQGNTANTVTTGCW